MTADKARKLLASFRREHGPGPVGDLLDDWVLSDEEIAEVGSAIEARLDGWERLRTMSALSVVAADVRRRRDREQRRYEAELAVHGERKVETDAEDDVSRSNLHAGALWATLDEQAAVTYVAASVPVAVVRKTKGTLRSRRTPGRRRRSPGRRRGPGREPDDPHDVARPDGGAS